VARTTPCRPLTAPGHSPARCGAERQDHRHALGWQPSRFLTDRAEAEHAFALAEQLGSVNAAAQELGTTWPSLRKAFTRHGLGMPARNPEAVRQRAIAAASQRAGPPTAPPPDPVFVMLNPGQLPTRRGPQAEQGIRLRRAEEIETLSYRTMVDLNAESRLAPERRVATIARRPERAQRLVDERAGRADRRQVGQLVPSAPSNPTDPWRGGWSPMPADPIHPDQLGGEQRFRADLVAYLDSLPAHELADLLGELPSSRQEPLRLGVLMVALNERLPDAYKLLPPAGQPGPHEGRRRTMGRWSPTAAPPVPPAGPGRHGRGWSNGRLTASGRPSSMPTAAVPARLASGGWRKRCAPSATRRAASRRLGHQPDSMRSATTTARTADLAVSTGTQATGIMAFFIELGSRRVHLAGVTAVVSAFGQLPRVRGVPDPAGRRPDARVRPCQEALTLSKAVTCYESRPA
jgi:hypothetical protein